MKLPKKYFENLNAAKYREYLKLLPNIQQENTRIITTLIFTFIAMSFFGVFAINPTLSTIVNLKKQLSDSQLVHEKLGVKINNLSSLQSQYTTLGPDLPFVFSAVPQTSKVPILAGQIYSLANTNNVELLSISASGIQLIGPADSSNKTSFSLSVRAKGSYDSLINFIKGITRIDRIVSVDSIAFNKDSKETGLFTDIKATAYFQK